MGSKLAIKFDAHPLKALHRTCTMRVMQAWFEGEATHAQRLFSAYHEKHIVLCNWHLYIHIACAIWLMRK